MEKNVNISEIESILSKLTENPKENILMILKGVQKAFGSTLSIYNRFENDYTTLTTYTNRLNNFNGSSSNSTGHICTDIALMDMSKPNYIQDLLTTNYQYTDEAVKTYNLRTYIGMPVKLKTKVLGVLSVVYDHVTELKTSDNKFLSIMASMIGTEECHWAALEKEEKMNKRYNLIFDQLSTGIFLLHGNKIVDANPKSCQLFGLTKENIVGKTPIDLSPKYQPDGNLSQKKALLYIKAARNKQQVFEWTHKKANGRPFHAKVTLISTHSEENVEELIAFIQDITTYKNHELELITARKKAENADKLKSIFLANMSHEIRTPLNSIIGFSDLLLDEDSSAEDRQLFADMIKTAGKSLLQLIEDIIDISKIEAGQLAFRKEAFDVNESLNKLYLNIEKEKINRGKGQLKIKLIRGYKGPLMIESDEIRFHQIFTNLLTNAIKFTDQGSIEFGYIGISSSSIQFYVKDTGNGISGEEIPLVFKRFGQATQDYTQNKDGKGLGLAITQSLVQLLGGKIWVDSMPQKGSTFYFTLPIGTDYAIKMNPLYGTRYNDVFVGKTILIVDNEPENYHFLRGNLTATGANFAYSKGGEEAVKFCLENEEIDLVLMDIIMPNVNGYEATAKIKKLKPRLPIIAVTAFNNQEEKIMSLQSGCDDYLTKPINFNELFGLLTRYLNQ